MIYGPSPTSDWLKSGQSARGGHGASAGSGELLRILPAALPCFAVLL